MTKKGKRIQKKMLEEKKRRDKMEAWYYDACVIEREFFYSEITGKTKKYRRFITSNLAIGEAFANRCESSKKDNNPTDFVVLINWLREANKLEIKSNAGITIRRLTKTILEDFPFLDIADSVHLATAIKNKCQVFRTTDRHFIEEDQKKIIKLAKENGCRSFCIKYDKRPIK